MKSKNLTIGILLIFMLLNLTSCAPKEYTHNVYGFFSGIIHGFVFFFSLIGKLFGLDIGLYAENNSGFFYWLGFIIGIGGFGGGANSRR